MKEYFNDVKSRAFPGDEHCYHMIKGEEEKLAELIKQYE